MYVFNIYLLLSFEPLSSCEQSTQGEKRTETIKLSIKIIQSVAQRTIRFIIYWQSFDSLSMTTTAIYQHHAQPNMNSI